ncbi:MAG: DUF3047 domain-containing protein [Oligoflexia bacterium]|nr:DUF3047 domain-containing protein [Oligoflexia bacterium]
MDNDRDIVIEDFEGQNLKKSLPYGWNKKGDDLYYRLNRENRNAFLAGDYDCGKIGKGKGTILFREYKINYKKYPFFSWKWRIRQTPEGSDEKLKDKGDSAVAVYVYIRSGMFTRKIIKFVWSQKYKAGEVFESPNSIWAWETKVYVVRGTESRDLLGKWVSEKINLAGVYEKLYSKKLKNSVKGFGVITDADNTCSVAAGDYDDFTMTRQ